MLIRLNGHGFRPRSGPLPTTLRSRPRLGQAAGNVEQAVLEIASMLDQIARRLGAQLDLALDPIRYREVPAMGELTRGQTLEAVAQISDQLKSVALAVASPPLGPYLTPASTELLEAAVGRLGSIPSIARARGAEPLPADKRSVVDVYAELYFSDVMSKIIDAERFVVGLEQGSVDLKEPVEKERETAVKVLAGVGIIAVVGICAYFLLGAKGP